MMGKLHMPVRNTEWGKETNTTYIKQDALISDTLQPANKACISAVWLETYVKGM